MGFDLAFKGLNYDFEAASFTVVTHSVQFLYILKLSTAVDYNPVVRARKNL